MMHRPYIPFGILCLVLASRVPAFARQPVSAKDHHVDVILGVLEDEAGEYAGEHARKVRACFRKVGDRWQPFPVETASYLDLKSLPKSYPRQMTWIIAFHGKNLGTIRAQTPAQFNFYSEIGTELITSRGPVPTIGRKSADFYDFGDSLYRPLVAVSQPNVTDPDKWHDAKLSPAEIKIARDRFRARFPSVSNCRNPYENIARRWHYRDKDIHVAEAHSSKEHWLLVSLHLSGDACDGPPDPAFQDQWFVIRPSGKISFIGQGMRFVDAGDYDKSGQSQLLFQIDEINTGGYHLFYRNFTRDAEFVFHYH